MLPQEGRQKTRRELLRQYLQLQRELLEGDPGSSAYQSSIHAFRQIGYALISSGFEDDLDRLLRIRVVNGGRKQRSPRKLRSAPADLHLLERRAR